MAGIAAGGGTVIGTATTKYFLKKRDVKAAEKSLVKVQAAGLRFAANWTRDRTVVGEFARELVALLSHGGGAALELLAAAEPAMAFVIRASQAGAVIGQGAGVGARAGMIAAAEIGLGALNNVGHALGVLGLGFNVFEIVHTWTSEDDKLKAMKLMTQKLRVVLVETRLLQHLAANAAADEHGLQ